MHTLRNNAQAVESSHSGGEGSLRCAAILLAGTETWRRARRSSWSTSWLLRRGLRQDQWTKRYNCTSPGKMLLLLYSVPLRQGTPCYNVLSRWMYTSTPSSCAPYPLLGRHPEEEKHGMRPRSGALQTVAADQPKASRTFSFVWSFLRFPSLRPGLCPRLPGAATSVSAVHATTWENVQRALCSTRSVTLHRPIEVPGTHTPRSARRAGS